MIIYKITNTINNKCYIGRTIQKMKCRKNFHLYCKNKDIKYHLYNAIRKYGEKNFKWEIIKRCDCESDLISYEKFYINKFDSYRNGYNQTEGGEGIFGYKHTEETKKKISDAHKGKKLSERHKRKIGQAHKGKIITENTRKRMSKGQKKRFKNSGGTNKGRQFSEEHKNKISSALKGRKLSEEHKKKLSISKTKSKILQ